MTDTFFLTVRIMFSNVWKLDQGISSSFTGTLILIPIVLCNVRSVSYSILIAVSRSLKTLFAHLVSTRGLEWRCCLAEKINSQMTFPFHHFNADPVYCSSWHEETFVLLLCVDKIIYSECVIMFERIYL